MSRAAETTPTRFLAIAEGTGFLGRSQTEDERAGFRTFFSGLDALPPRTPAERLDQMQGRRLAHAVAFAQGALANTEDRLGEHVIGNKNPYPKLSSPGIAWMQGFNAAAQAALEIED